MKKIFFAAIALVALASCAKEEFVSVNRQVISFGEAFVDNATRATDMTYGNITGFDVYGTVTGSGSTTAVALYGGDGATVTRGNAAYNVAWGCSETEFWVPGASYKFAAVIDATTSVANGLPATLTTVADPNMNFKDMLYDEETVTSASAVQDVVKFTFAHLLSKVQFTVTSNADDGYYHEVANIKVNNFETGTYTIATDTWAGTTPKDVNFGTITNVTSASTGDNAATNATQMLLVPTTDSFNVEFTVNLYKSTTKDGVTTNTLLGTTSYTGVNAKTVSTDLVKGNAYNFTIACSVGNPIQFSVTNNPTWNSDIDGDGEVDANDNVKIE